MITFEVQDRKEVNLPRHVQYIYEVDCGFGDGTHALLLVVQIIKKSVLPHIVNQYLILPEHWKDRNHKAMHKVGNPKRNNGYKKIYHYRIEFPSDQNEHHPKIMEAIREWNKLKGK
jgi:hypothetical protein